MEVNVSISFGGGGNYTYTSHDFQSAEEVCADLIHQIANHSSIKIDGTRHGNKQASVFFTKDIAAIICEELG